MIAFIRHLILKDFWLKLFSLALAVVTWFTVNFAMRNKTPSLGIASLYGYQMTLHKVPVVVLSSALDVHDFRVAPKEVDVTVTGDPRVLQKLQSSEIRALVDLTGVETASDLRKRIEVSTPAGVTFVRVEPPDVKVIFP